jgi:uncharacterized protein (DUF433 family)
MAIIRALRFSMDCDRLSWIMFRAYGPSMPIANARQDSFLEITCYNRAGIDMATPTLTNPKNLADYVLSDPERLGGEPVFKGTRVPVRSLFEHLRGGIPLEEFLDDFEGVTKAQAEAVLELAELNILQQVYRP